MSFGGDANPDNVFSGEITHFHGNFQWVESLFLHRLTLLCVQQFESCCLNILWGGRHCGVPEYSGLPVPTTRTGRFFRIPPKSRLALSVCRITSYSWAKLNTMLVASSEGHTISSPSAIPGWSPTKISGGPRFRYKMEKRWSTLKRLSIRGGKKVARRGYRWSQTGTAVSDGHPVAIHSPRRI